MVRFERGDLVEDTKHGGLGLVVGHEKEMNMVDWIIPPDNESIYRDRHPEFDFLTGGYKLRKIGEIKL